MAVQDFYQGQLLDDLRKNKPLRPPHIFKEGAFTVIDDRSKLRAAAHVMQNSLSRSFFVAGSPYGATVEAAAIVAQSLHRKLTIVFTQTANDVYATLESRMQQLGARTMHCPYDEFNIVSGIAKTAAANSGAEYIDFTDDVVVDAMATGLSQLHITSGDIWTAGGLGTLGRAIHQGMGKDMRLMVVDVAGQPNAKFKNAHHVIRCTQPFHEKSTAAVPFPCNDNFERKAWPMMMAHYQNRQPPTDGVYFMNPAFK